MRVYVNTPSCWIAIQVQRSQGLVLAVHERSGASQAQPKCDSTLDRAAQLHTLFSASNEKLAFSFDLPRGERASLLFLFGKFELLVSNICWIQYSRVLERWILVPFSIKTVGK